MDEKIKRLNEICYTKKIPESFRLFLITKKEYLRIYYGQIEFSQHAEKFGIKSLRKERGAILEMFSKLEFFVNEIIQLKLLGANSDKSEILDKILENVDFFSRIKILYELKFIDSVLYNYINQSKQVRNGLAHRWSLNDVTFKGESIDKSFPVFISDMEKIWEGLLKIYDEEQKKIDIDKLLEDIESSNVV